MLIIAQLLLPLKEIYAILNSSRLTEFHEQTYAPLLLSVNTSQVYL